MLTKVDRIVNVMLFTVRHHYADNSVFSQCLAAKGSGN